jgi:transposase InsO family protein
MRSFQISSFDWFAIMLSELKTRVCTIANRIHTWKGWTLTKRRHGFNDKLSPAEFERRYFERLAGV